jgi:Flp pilus assembly protein TadD
LGQQEPAAKLCAEVAKVALKDCELLGQLAEVYREAGQKDQADHYRGQAIELRNQQGLSRR